MACELFTGKDNKQVSVGKEVTSLEEMWADLIIFPFDCFLKNQVTINQSWKHFFGKKLMQK